MPCLLFNQTTTVGILIYLGLLPVENYQIYFVVNIPVIHCVFVSLTGLEVVVLIVSFLS